MLCEKLVHKRRYKTGRLNKKYERQKRKIINVGSKGSWLKLSGDGFWTHINDAKPLH